MKVHQVTLKNGQATIPAVSLKRQISALLLIILTVFNSCKMEGVLEPEIPPGAKSAANTSGPEALAVPEFTLVVMPDTQHYMAAFLGGTYAMFTAQINWIKANKGTHNIVYVAGVGDIVEHGDNPTFAANEWTEAATNGYHRLESDNIPYGLAVGNHDQGLNPYNDWGDAVNSPTAQYNNTNHFGIGHFNNAAHPYWKGNYGINNDSHYDFFSAGGLNFMVIYIEYDSYNAPDVRANMNQWARELCIANPGRKVIVVTHHMIQVGEQHTFKGAVEQGAFSGQGLGIYNALKDLSNVFMFLGGHVVGTEADGYPGEGYREDTHNGHTIRTYLSNYQNRAGGGYGRMRLMRFSIDNDEVSVKTFTPVTGAGAPAPYETDVNSQFTKPLFGPAPTFQVPNGKYQIIAKHSGQALVVKDAALVDTARIVQWDYADNGVHNDQWTFTQLGTSGYYKITNVHSGKEMVIAGISTAYGSGNVGLAVQWGPYGAPAPPWNDDWALIPVGGGYYKIIARHSGLCLNVAGGDNTLGAQVKQWKYLATDGVDNDQFQLIPIP